MYDTTAVSCIGAILFLFYKEERTLCLLVLYSYVTDIGSYSNIFCYLKPIWIT